ncbi:TraI domain-containing protein [Noviherbaspirillum pedocola]|uniref:TraI domain-containing protein n=1 Tax=Noviherbaspirillum pedocola TaxID=2801341 RepID=A0A934SZR6_9BURK|nr:TraI domain-containing protein [Noviherbaspirillum pedocola]MBK4736022.1 TraI domain-containing protein [Noviherbaspirillum pedocola]
MDDFLQPVSPASLFASSAQQIDEIRTAAGFTKAQFDAAFMPLLHEYACQVQQLPLSTKVYREPGGAWSFGLFVSVLTLRVSATRMFFPTLDSTQRRTLEVQARFAAFAAGLASGVAVLAQNVALSSRDGGYHPLSATGSLRDWLAAAREPRFAWTTNEPPLSPTECAAVAARFIPGRLVQVFDMRIVRMIYNAIYPQAAPNALETTLGRVVRESIDACANYYLEKAEATYDKQQQQIALPTATEANRLASDMAEEASGEIVANPLDAPDALPAPPAPTASSAPAAPATPATPHPGDAASGGSAFLAKHNLKLKSALTAAPVPEEQSAPALTHEALLAAADPALQDWFRALRTHEKFDRLAQQLKMTEDGIEVPSSLIGSLGLNLTTVLTLMEAAGMIVRRGKGGQHVYLHTALQPLFFDNDA